MNLWKYYDNNQTQLIYPNVLKDILNHTHEKEIAKTNPKWAFEYALNHGKDEELESIIAKSADYSFKYTYEILHNKPFPLGEPAIAKDPYYSKKYTNDVLKKDFILDGKLICKYKG